MCPTPGGDVAYGSVEKQWRTYVLCRKIAQIVRFILPNTLIFAILWSYLSRRLYCHALNEIALSKVYTQYFVQNAEIIHIFHTKIVCNAKTDVIEYHLRRIRAFSGSLI